MIKSSRWLVVILLFVLIPFAFGEKISVGTFSQESRIFYSTKDGLPSDNITVVLDLGGHVIAGTDKGAAVFDGHGWNPIKLVPEKPVVDIASNGPQLGILVKTEKGHELYILSGHSLEKKFEISDKYDINPQSGVLSFAQDAYLAASNDLLKFSTSDKKFKPESLKMPSAKVNEICVNGDNLWVAADQGLFKYSFASNVWENIYPSDGTKSWAPVNVNGAMTDAAGDFWFASPQGVGRYNGKWTLFTGHEGLPFNEFTCAVAGPAEQIWFGTTMGAIWWEGNDFRYRQGLRWLPDDKINDVTVDKDGNAWFATNKGVGLIKFEPMTLAEKAKFYEDEIDKYNRRTEYEFVLEVSTNAPGDKSVVHKQDSDNDGLWTTMYGAGECYAYAATKDPLAKKRAEKVFDAMKFLGDVTQGGQYSPDPGYVARSVLPTSGPNPNDGRVESDRRNKAKSDTLWKVFDPRWPVSKDGKWYWKGDTSSDELDGHFYFYGLYYDLVADTDTEKERVRQHVKRLIDHLVSYDFQLFDHDGKPTRWSRFSPKELNSDLNWAFDRGINSLSMISYLTTAAHITGDDTYRKIARTLIDEHGYMQNAHYPKVNRGAGTGNQSDDEMNVMNFYNLLKYTNDQEIKSRMALSFWSYWRILEPEMNPFFNYAIAAANKGVTCTDAFGTYNTEPAGNWSEESAETLVRFPLDRFNWAHKNSHRLDIIHFEEWMRGFDEGSIKGDGKRVNGKVIPVDETHFNHWNHNRWQLNNGGNGQGLADGAVYLLPYYMGLYYGFIE